MQCHLLLYGSFALLLVSCTKPLVKADENLAGYVIAKETCHTDASRDAWLLDMTVWPGTPPVGDTIVIDNLTYTNVLKIRNLHPDLRKLGLRVSIEYRNITGKFTSDDCDVAMPIVYLLREIIATHQAEIR